MLFEYIDFNKRLAHCDIERYGSLLIITELASNPGASVTNACEYIIMQYAVQHGLQHEDLTIVERYDHRSYDGIIPEGKEFPNYSTVTLKPGEWIPGKPTPQWKYMPAEEFNDLRLTYCNIYR